MLAVIVIGVFPVTVPIDVARPELEIVTWVVSLEVQLTMFVMSVPSCAVAVNCCDPPWRILGAVGVLVMEVTEDGRTVNVAEPLNPCELAVMVVVPGVTPVAIPLFGSIDPTVGPEDDQSTPLVMLLREPSS